MFGIWKKNTKQLIKHPSINFLLSELRILCAPLTWQEEENFWRKAHLAALSEALCFASVSVESWIVIIYLFTGLTGQCLGSQNS